MPLKVRTDEKAPNPGVGSHGLGAFFLKDNLCRINSLRQHYLRQVRWV